MANLGKTNWSSQSDLTPWILTLVMPIQASFINH